MDGVNKFFNNQNLLSIYLLKLPDDQLIALFYNSPHSGLRAAILGDIFRRTSAKCHKVQEKCLQYDLIFRKENSKLTKQMIDGLLRNNIPLSVRILTIPYVHKYELLFANKGDRDKYADLVLSAGANDYNTILVKYYLSDDKTAIVKELIDDNHIASIKVLGLINTADQLDNIISQLSKNMQHEDVAIRIESVKSLGALVINHNVSSKKVIDCLQKGAQDKNFLISRACVIILGRIAQQAIEKISCKEDLSKESLLNFILTIMPTRKDKSSVDVATILFHYYLSSKSQIERFIFDKKISSTILPDVINTLKQRSMKKDGSNRYLYVTFIAWMISKNSSLADKDTVNFVILILQQGMQCKQVNIRIQCAESLLLLLSKINYGSEELLKIFSQLVNIVRQEEVSKVSVKIEEVLMFLADKIGIFFNKILSLTAKDVENLAKNTPDIYNAVIEFLPKNWLQLKKENPGFYNSYISFVPIILRELHQEDFRLQWRYMRLLKHFLRSVSQIPQEILTEIISILVEEIRTGGVPAYEVSCLSVIVRSHKISQQDMTLIGSLYIVPYHDETIFRGCSSNCVTIYN